MIRKARELDYTRHPRPTPSVVIERAELYKESEDHLISKTDVRTSLRHTITSPGGKLSLSVSSPPASQARALRAGGN